MAHSHTNNQTHTFENHSRGTLNCICISLALNKVNVELPEKLGQRWGNLLVFFSTTLCKSLP